MTETTDHTPAGENPIDGAAAEWTARLDRGALNPADAALFEAWLAADVRHRGAFARAQAAFATLDRARALGAHVTGENFADMNLSDAPAAWPPQAANADTPRASRRAVLAGGAAAAAALAAVFGPGV